MNLQIIKPRPLIGVGVIAIREDKVLLGKRKGAHGTGEWSFPGGHLEFGESVEACAKRELAEETGLQALSIKLGPWTEDMIENNKHYIKHYITLFVFTSDIKGEPQLLEPHKCEGWQWFAWNEFPSPLFLPIRSLLAKFGIEKLQNFIVQ